MRILGFVLVVAGLIALVAGGFRFTRKREVVHMGPVSASVRETQSYPMARWAGGALLLVGLGLVIASNRKRA